MEIYRPLFSLQFCGSSPRWPLSQGALRTVTQLPSHPRLPPVLHFTAGQVCSTIFSMPSPVTISPLAPQRVKSITGPNWDTQSSCCNPLATPAMKPCPPCLLFYCAEMPHAVVFLLGINFQRLHCSQSRSCSSVVSVIHAIHASPIVSWTAVVLISCVQTLL